MSLAKIEDAINAFQQGQMVIIVDDEDRENEGDLVVAADFATPETINFMAQHGRGLICTSMTRSRLTALGLPLMVAPDRNQSGFGTPFTISVEAKEGVTTGISAQDRARTVATLIDPNSTADDIVTPGHTFPLQAHDEGVLGRRGQTEASVDLARLAGLTPAAVICEILHEDGSMKRLPQLELYAEEHGLLIISVDDLVTYRQEKALNEQVVFVAESVLPTQFGDFRAIVYRDDIRDKDHVALIAGEWEDAPLVRLHSECLTGDAFGSERCDCGSQLQAAQKRIIAEGGVILYLRQEGRGIGLANKIKAYALQDQGYDTVEANVKLGFGADLRRYEAAAQMLLAMNISRIRLLTNNPAKIAGLTQHGITVVERVPHIVEYNSNNRDYLDTKRQKMDHLLPPLDDDKTT